MKRVLVTSCDAKFVDGAAALLRSAKRHHPDIERICFVPPAEYAAKAVRLGDLAEIRPFPFKVKGVPDNRQANVARVFAATVDADVVAYIDSDVVFAGPAPELWEVPAGKVNAVADDSVVIGNNLAGDNLALYKKQCPAMAAKKGVNTGVFALRSPEWKDLPGLFEDALLNGGYQYESIIDQPILNGLFDGRINLIPRVFNAHGLFDQLPPKGVRLVHFTGKTKPWQSAFPKHEPAYWYWLKHGAPEPAGWLKLSCCALWIALVTPKRMLGRLWRRIKTR